MPTFLASVLWVLSCCGRVVRLLRRVWLTTWLSAEPECRARGALPGVLNYTAQVKLWYQRLQNCRVLGSSTEMASMAHETNTCPLTEEMTVTCQPEVAPEVVELQPVSFFTERVHVCSRMSVLQPPPPPPPPRARAPIN